MMPCETCGAATKCVESEGSVYDGEFVERYECANGHTGRIKGDAGKPGHTWNRYGAVFNGRNATVSMYD